MLGLGLGELLITLIVVSVLCLPFLIVKYLGRTLLGQHPRMMKWYKLITSTKGRIGRGDWLRGTILLWGIGFILLIIGVIMEDVLNPYHSDPVNTAGPYISQHPLQLPFFLWIFIAQPPWIALNIKRLHDRNKSAWYIPLFYILWIIGLVWIFVELGGMKGTEGPNRFGSDPLEHS